VSELIVIGWDGYAPGGRGEGHPTGCSTTRGPPCRPPSTWTAGYGTRIDDREENNMTHAQRPSMVPTVSGNWWALALRGAAAVLFGLTALTWPGLTLAVLIVLYGAFAVVDGAFAIVAGVRAGNGTQRWLLLAEGALGVLAGLIAVLWPGITALVLLYVISFWAIFGGILRVVGAILLRREIDNEWSMALSGVLWVLLGLALAVLPGVGLLSLAWLIGVFALGAGVTLLVLAFKVRGRHTAGATR
jgi:uncharacterized membrane protein HdeD (DUF308 family)